MRLVCPYCQQGFAPSAEQQALLGKVDAGLMKFAIIECRHCRQTIRHEARSDPATQPAHEDWPCPTAGCTGRVVRIDDVTGFACGCGECGMVWRSREELLKAGGKAD